ncbi:uncharacterized protein LOC112178662 isoform X3 [Rosa chinensis]|uniref:uncharacterized protein LOC112178662 isoform X3 n=1 Tax=Rosa chinensis TaxID=74649 RepID=UPI001AD8E5E1|nr:uncharacterized protein LOC112178662 isoform X3 [Rosa chinensis]
MAISSLGFACRPNFNLRTPTFQCMGKVQLNLVSAMEAIDEQEGRSKDNKTNDSASGMSNFCWDEGGGKAPQWKKLNSKEVGISGSMIDKPTRKVLNALKREGFEVYLVGGCVRDLILKRTPKDFDILTSAELREVTRTFAWCQVVGRRFPICHVHIGDTVVEVQTVVPASTSFREDCARILRAIRIAARLGFRISKETANSIKNLSYSILRLDKGRILMEMNYMMAYGSAEASLRLLWRFGLLELLLPIQAAYFVRHGFRRRDKRSNMLLSLFSNLDKLLAPDKPCHSSLWIAILAFHKALSEQPRDALVVAAFTLAVHNGGDMPEAVDIARTITKPYVGGFHELLEPKRLDSEAYDKEVKDLEASFRLALHHMTDQQIVSEAMAEYPQAPFSDLVFIPWGLSLRVSQIFNCVKVGGKLGFGAKQGSKIDYESLAQGSLLEVRHIFARVVFDTIYPL